MTRDYKDYKIQITKVENDYGTGYKAVFYIPKTNGTKEGVRVYEDYRKGVKAGMVLMRVATIIDNIK